MMKRFIFFSLPLLLLISVSLSCDDAAKNKYRNELRAGLKKMCEGLPVSAEFVKVNTSEMIKSNAGTYSFGFQGKTTCDVVKEHYSSVLFPQGWTLGEENNSFSIFTGDTQTYLSYYKGSNRISVTCEKTNSPSATKRFSVSCGWSRNGY